MVTELEPRDDTDAGASVGNALRRSAKRKMVRFALSDEPQPGERHAPRAALTDDAAGYADADASEVLLWRFETAIDSHDAVKLHEVLREEEQRVAGGLMDYCLPEEEKAKQLALAMLSGDEVWYEALAPHVSVEGADEWLISTQPHSRCDCCDAHRGSLLVRVARGGRRNMVARCLEGGLDPDAFICDGATVRMAWRSDEAARAALGGDVGGDYSDDLDEDDDAAGGHEEPAPDADGRRSGFGKIKLDAQFSKSTALDAASARGDTRMLDLLLGFGANPLANGMSAVDVAARFGHVYFLQALLCNERLADDPALAGRACVVALKSASIAGQERTIEWLLLRLQQLEDWKVLKNSNAKAAPALLARPPSQGSASGVSALLARPRSLGVALLRRASGSGGALAAMVASSVGSPQAAAYATSSQARLASSGSPREATLNPRFSDLSGGSGGSGGATAAAAASKKKIQGGPLVKEALNSALEDMVNYAKEPGAAMREGFAGGIERVLELQRKHFKEQDASMDPRKLLSVYLAAIQDDGVITSADLANTLLGIGLGDYLSGDGEQAPKRAASTAGRNTSAAPGAQQHKTPPPQQQQQKQQKQQQQQQQRSGGGIARKLSGVLFGRGAKAQAKSSSDISGGGGSRSKRPAVLDRDRQAVLLAAAQHGHVDGLRSLLPHCSDAALGKLLVVAVRHFQAEAVHVLLHEMMERKRASFEHWQQRQQASSAHKSSSSDAAALKRRQQQQEQQQQQQQQHEQQSQEQPQRVAELGVDVALLTTALLEALRVGNIATAEVLLGKGARATGAELASTLGDVLASGNKGAARAIPLIIDLASDSAEAGDFGRAQLERALERGLESADAGGEAADKANRRAMRILLKRAREPFVTALHLRQALKRSQGRKDEDEWRILADALVRNYQRATPPAQAKQELKDLLRDAEAMSNVHVGFLTLLVSLSEPTPRSSVSSGGSERAEDSRWL